ncbi:MAG: LTA synthase family protein [Clostridiales bacterium]|nr:LTA synthase family protein [Clostridiales bacterium]
MNTVKTSFFPKIKEICGRIYRYCEKRPVYTLICLAPLLNIIVEMLSRRSFTGVFISIWRYPAFFVVNTMIVFLSFLPSLFVKRRCFAQSLTALIWLGLGITNFILMGYRTTPLSAADLKTLPSVWSIMSIYLSLAEIIAIAAAFAAAVTLVVFAFRLLPKSPRITKKAVVTSGFAVGIFALSIFCGYRLNIMPQSVPNLAEAYKQYGFAWCFSLSAVDRGIDEPEDYSELEFRDILNELENGTKPNAPLDNGEKVNVVMVQLESFTDISELKNIECSGNPTRVFHALKTGGPSGYLTVPVVGAGTVNTEFEVLTGMNLDYFGTGEIPYNTILQTQTCESLPYNLRELGYTSHALHNHIASFYDRDVVYANLGFDTFTSLENMSGVEYNALGWAKDSVLTGEIIKAMKSTDGADFVFAVSVQAHGKYPAERLEGVDYSMSVSGVEDEALAWGYNYYINELRQTDVFVGELVKAMAEYDEPVLLVFYGDHLPSLEIEPEMTGSGSVYTTEYVIWSNYGLTAYDCDLSAYQLSAYVMELLGYDNGIITKVHQNRDGTDPEEYQQKLEALEYDMLYGELEVYGGVSPYEPTRLQMGIDKITLSSVGQKGEVFFARGSGFTPWSVVFADGERLETLFVDEKTLIVVKNIPEAGQSICVVQLADDGSELGRSGEIKIKAG